MIVLMQGVPGSGKSYEAVVYHLLPALERGRKIVTNMPLNIEAFAALDSSYADLIEIRSTTDENCPMFSRAEHYDCDWQGVDRETGLAMHALFVLDECHEFLPPKGVPDEVKNVFAMHRHRGIDIVLMTQNYRDIEKSIISRVDHMIEVRNNKARGLKKVYTRFYYRRPQDRKPQDVQYRQYKSEYFCLYQSYTQGGSGLELGSTDVRKLWAHPIFWLGGPVLLLVFGYAIYGALSLAFGWGKKPAEAQPQKSEVSQPAATAASAMPQAVAVSVKGYLKTLQGVSLAGVVRTGNDIFILTRDDTGSVHSHRLAAFQQSGWDVVDLGPCSLVVQRKGSGERQMLSCK